MLICSLGHQFLLRTVSETLPRHSLHLGGAGQIERGLGSLQWTLEEDQRGEVEKRLCKERDLNVSSQSGPHDAGGESVDCDPRALQLTSQLQRNNNDAAGGRRLQEVQQEVGEEDVAEVIHTELHLKIILRLCVGTLVDSSIVDENVNLGFLLKAQLTSLISSQNLRTDVREARSRCLMTTSPCSGPACFRMSFAASSAPRRSRQAMMTRALSFSSSPARAFPIPQLAPVTMTVFPRIVSAEYRSSFTAFCCRGNRRRMRSRTPPPTTAATNTAVDMREAPGTGKDEKKCDVVPKNNYIEVGSDINITCLTCGHGEIYWTLDTSRLNSSHTVLSLRNFTHQSATVQCHSTDSQQVIGGTTINTSSAQREICKTRKMIPPHLNVTSFADHLLVEWERELIKKECRCEVKYNELLHSFSPLRFTGACSLERLEPEEDSSDQTEQESCQAASVEKGS
ncbi:hypothetical protein F7725_019788 [Dissostichus mawsoni]|uniref:Uncharacterized protein n=1 Tax=Dissostichus mawsoni TaxID=36200 RepID=A0A7J5YMT2_DISMA|nr:hypothetical protein F7725_019788 [Dissostichus mawsoni]